MSSRSSAYSVVGYCCFHLSNAAMRSFAAALLAASAKSYSARSFQFLAGLSPALSCAAKVQPIQAPSASAVVSDKSCFDSTMHLHPFSFFEELVLSGVYPNPSASRNHIHDGTRHRLAYTQQFLGDRVRARGEFSLDRRSGINPL